MKRRLGLIKKKESKAKSQVDKMQSAVKNQKRKEEDQQKQEEGHRYMERKDQEVQGQMKKNMHDEKPKSTKMKLGLRWKNQQQEMLIQQKQQGSLAQ